MAITNYIKVSENIHTSGQPVEGEFGSIAAMGVDTVINLAMPDSMNALVNEGNIVTSNGMNYFHTPVVWEAPEAEQFSLFLTLMNTHKDKNVWVHCALNWRVSSFIYLYKIIVLGHDNKTAYAEMKKVWEPNEVWQTFIDKMMLLHMTQQD